MFVSSCICWLLTTTAVVSFYGNLGAILLPIIIKILFRAKIDLEEHSKDGETWALVTGATDGIGKAFAFKLAEKGFNIILVSRSDIKLDKVKDELKLAYPKINVKCIRVDFVLDQVAGYKLKIRNEIQGMKVSVLVNNVGIIQKRLDRFHDISEEDANDVINCNITSFSTLSRIVIPQMIERKFGVIINISSLAGQFDFPGLSVYSATKAYMTKVSDVMAAEYSQDGIIIQTVNPGYVKTKAAVEFDLKAFSMLPNWSKNTPENLAAVCLKSLGKEQRLTGHWFHTVQEILSKYTNVLPWITAKTGLEALAEKKNN